MKMAEITVKSRAVDCAVYYSILDPLAKFPFHKQSEYENALLTKTVYCSQLHICLIWVF